VVAQSSLFIHHGGNNSFCEALYHGVPSLIMPYCWDGHDNAQRAVATGVGRSMHRSAWEPDDLRAAIEALLGDTALRSRLAGISARMKADPGTTRAAQSILDVIGAGTVAEERDEAVVRL
jgi:UDP:flavonoid glycosyltransferase YjiC (YdhE family)